MRSDTPLAVYCCRQDEFDRLRVPADIETCEEFARAGAAVGDAVRRRVRWAAPS